MEPNLNEVRAIEYIAGFDQQLITSKIHLEERLRSIPDGWRQYRIAETAISKVLEGLYDTLDIKTLLHMKKVSDYGEIIIRPKPAIPQKDIQFVDPDDLRVLINETMRATCAICLKDKKEVKKCKLRKSLMQICQPDAIPSNGSCPYSEVAMDCDLGEYI